MKYFFLTLSVIFILAACNKTPTVTQSRADMLRTGRWKVSSGTVMGRLPSGLDTTVSYTTFLIPGCYTDDYIVFDTQLHGAIYSGTNKCDPSQPDHIDFLWQLSNNNNSISLYNGFNMIYGYNDTIRSLVFDTLVNDINQTPPVVVDTIHGVFDTAAGYTRSLVVLDTIWKLKLTPQPIANFNIVNATISNFSQSSFTLSFSYITTYLDTTNHHTGKYYYSIGGSALDSLDFVPIVRPDTLRYNLQFTNF